MLQTHGEGIALVSPRETCQETYSGGRRAIHIPPRLISTIAAAVAVPMMNCVEAAIGEMILGSTTRKSVKVNEDKST